ncbi:hypothetical protein OIO90_004882 [Microbotryomycetes sp. JL221]|nr:hypothetical protein OIO90_004882 [Microbotryomycetes sp. JL221]
MTAKLFGSSSYVDRTEDAKQRAFVRLKSVCVPLSAATKDSATRDNFRTILNLLKQLETELESVPSAVFTAPLANYVFFPLASLLQPKSNGSPTSDTILEHTMIVLATLVVKWRVVGMDERVLHQLWTMISLQLGGPLDPNGPNAKLTSSSKGKAVERTEECQLAMVRALLALIGPLDPEECVAEQGPLHGDEDDDPLGENIDWSADEPRDLQTRDRRQIHIVPAPSSPRVPIVFHTLTTLLDISYKSSSLQSLQIESLKALEFIIVHHLQKHPPSSEAKRIVGQGPSPLLATALPGTASTLCRITLSASHHPPAEEKPADRRQHSGVIVQALKLLTLLLLATIGDEITKDLRSTEVPESAEQPTTLNDLFAHLSTNGTSSTAPGQQDSSNGEPADPQESRSEAKSSASAPGPVKPSPSWLKYTMTSVSALIGTLSPLSQHDNPLVRQQLAEFLSTLLDNAFESLDDARTIVIEGLLVVAGDAWTNVSTVAKKALHEGLGRAPRAGSSLSAIIASIVQNRMAMLPGQMRKRDHPAVVRSTRVITQSLNFVQGITGSDVAVAEALRNVNKWAWNVLDAVDIDDNSANSSSDEGARFALAWIDESSELGQTRSLLAPWPPIRLRHDAGDDGIVRSLIDMWRQLGIAAKASGQEPAVVESFLGTALGVRRWQHVAVNALWALDGVLAGVGQTVGSKRRRKLVNTVVKSLLSLLDELEQFSQQDQSSEMREEDKASSLTRNDSDQDVVIEHGRIISHTPALDGLKPVSALVTRKQNQERHRIMMMCFALRVIATCATQLEVDFQPHLLQTLYHVLANVSPSTNALLRAHAQAALSTIATSTSFASPQNLVMANVDYVVNSVSQRLSVGRLDPDAPLVLVEMIRLVGPPIVPMVQDLVEDVFEALDDYHGYDQVTMSLWAVMDALMRVMGEDSSVENGTKSNELGMPQVKAVVDAEADWTAFLTWYERRHDNAQDDLESVGEDLPRDNPQAPFDTLRSDGQEDETQAPPPEPEQAPATRHQSVASHIIAKAVYFLTHQSAFLRARVLALIATAVPLLVAPSDSQDPTSTRQSDLLPVIHRAWPYIVNRLSDKEHFVVIEAAALVEVLARHVGDFMSRRILDDAWPKLKKLLTDQAQLDQQSALKGSSNVKFTVSNKLYLSIVRTISQVIKHVPVKEDVSWEFGSLFKRFLTVDTHESLQQDTVTLYIELARLRPDTIWLVLGGAASYLRAEDKWSSGVDKILQHV